MSRPVSPDPGRWPGGATRALAVRPLAGDAFHPFGEVIPLRPAAGGRPVNAGTAFRHPDLATLDAAAGARLQASLFEVRSGIRAPAGAAGPILDCFERHPLASQAFLPLDPVAWCVVVAPARADGGPGAPVAFRPGPGEGVNIARGVWHHPLLAFGPCRFLVIDGGGDAANLELRRIEPPEWHLARPAAGWAGAA